MHTELILGLTMLDSLLGCLQVFNLMSGHRLRTFLTSLGISASKVVAILLVVKSNTPWDIAAYVVGGALGAQLSLTIKRK